MLPRCGGISGYSGGCGSRALSGAIALEAISVGRIEFAVEWGLSGAALPVG